MEIFKTPNCEILVLDSISGYNSFFNLVMTFIQSNDEIIAILGAKNETPSYNDSLLTGIYIKKAGTSITLQIKEDGWLELSGSIKNLKLYLSHFSFDECSEISHRHPEYHKEKDYISADSLNLTIELV